MPIHSEVTPKQKTAARGCRGPGAFGVSLCCTPCHGRAGVEAVWPQPRHSGPGKPTYGPLRPKGSSSSKQGEVSARHPKAPPPLPHVCTHTRAHTHIHTHCPGARDYRPQLSRRREGRPWATGMGSGHLRARPDCPSPGLKPQPSASHSSVVLVSSQEQAGDRALQAAVAWAPQEGAGRSWRLDESALGTQRV